MDISFSINNQTITRTDKNNVVSGSKNYLFAAFTFSDDWKNKIKTAQFTRGETVIDMLLVGDRCAVPRELLQRGGAVNVTVFGGDLITVNSATVHIAQSGYSVANTPVLLPTPNYYAQVVQALGVPGPQGPQGVPGPQGPQGEIGPQGIPGEVQLSDLTATNIDYTDTNSNLDDATDVQTALDSAGAQLSAIDTQLAQSANEFAYKPYYKQTDIDASTGNYVSFVFDDGYLLDYTKILPIAIEKNIPMSMCMITNKIGISPYMSSEQLLNLQNTYGWEIMSHTHTHASATLLTEEQLEYEFYTSKKILNDLGLKCESFVYPIGLYNSLSMKVASKYFRSALITEQYAPTNAYGKNKIPLESQKINRVFIDSATLSELKQHIDLMSNSWVIFYSHSDGMSAEIEQKLKDIIDYVKSKSIPILTISKVLDKLENKLEIMNGKESGRSVKVGADGKLYSGNIASEYIGQYIEVTNSTPLSFFPKYKVSVCSLITVDASLIPYGNGIGTLITYRTHEEDAVHFQEFHPMDNSCIVKRTWDKAGGVWKAWVAYKPYSGEVVATVYPEIGTLNANSSATFDLDVNGFNTTENIVATSRSALPDGIIMQVFVSTVNKVKIRFTNVTTSNIVVGTRAIRVMQH